MWSFVYKNILTKDVCEIVNHGSLWHNLKTLTGHVKGA